MNAITRLMKTHVGSHYHERTCIPNEPCTCTCTRARRCSDIRTDMQTSPHASTSSSISTRRYVHMQTSFMCTQSARASHISVSRHQHVHVYITRTHSLTYIHTTYMHTFTHTYIHTYLPTYVHTCIHTYIFATHRHNSVSNRSACNHLP